MLPGAGTQAYPEEFASLACLCIENGFMNGETIRLDGAIRMPKL